MLDVLKPARMCDVAKIQKSVTTKDQYFRWTIEYASVIRLFCLRRGARIMDSTFEHQQSGETSPQSLEASWQHGKELWSAKSTSDALTSLKKMFESTPIWAIVAGVLVVATFVTNPWITLVPAAGGLLVAVHYTAKHAVQSALREHESEPRQF